MKPRDLRLLVMHVSRRCDQACAHCSIWKTGKTGSELGAGERVAIIREAHALGARSILFTGGEPLLCDHIETLAREARGLGLSVQIATNGLGLSRSAPWLCDVVEEVYVSLDGPESIHDGIRGPRMFFRLKASIADLATRSVRPRLIGRSAISARSAAVLGETVAAARTLGLDALSFLPIDTTSDAFGGDPAGRALLRPRPADVADLRRAIAELAVSGELGDFVIEDQRRLMSMADRFLADATTGKAPSCNAPEWSSVIEADGAIRPCFFQPPVFVGGRGSLGAVRRSREYSAALRNLGDGDATCAECVCPKHLASGLASFRNQVRARLTRWAPQFRQRAGSAA